MLILVAALLFCPSVQAGEVTVAVASNFLKTAEALQPEFEQATGHRLILVGGATGKLAAQIMQGAPFAVFLSADAATPARLLATGKAIAGSSFTYALGRVALLGARDDVALRQGAFTHIAIANPKVAPYGVAGEEQDPAIYKL
ncbi:MAG: molybdate ABC transporter substrate-binding protein, partial [Aestuariivirgaceae bacterium]|nr:molybdate ABC transporter substrate-binding protein [Aestuariivirgaceae bacterium]